MAYSFVAANSRYLSTASSPATGSPMTIACWFKPNAVNVQKAVASVGVSGATHRNQLNQESASTLNATAQGSSSSGIADRTTSGLGGTWIHGTGVFTSTTSRTSYVNGVAGIANTTNLGSQNTANQILIGARTNTTVGLYFDGAICEVGIWDVALTAAEIASLAKGIRCTRIRPQNLKFYAPLIRDLIDSKGGIIITNNNSATVSDHPRIYG